MALITLFFQQRATIASMELDASLKETHSARAEVTKHEIQDGGKISDHVMLLPIGLTIEGVVSKTPLGVAGLIGSAATAAGGFFGGEAALGQGFGASSAGSAGIGAGAAAFGASALGSVAGLVASALGAEGPNSREPSDVFDYLMELRDARQTIEAQTALKLYKNMIVTGVDVPRDRTTVNHLQFTVTLEQVTLVTSQESLVPAFASTAAGAGASKAVNAGKQAASEASEKTATGAGSFLSNLTGFKG